MNYAMGFIGGKVRCDYYYGTTHKVQEIIYKAPRECTSTITYYNDMDGLEGKKKWVGKLEYAQLHNVDM